MDKGDVYVCAGRGDFQRKPRAGIVLQSASATEALDSVLVCPVTSFDEMPGRILIEATSENGLHRDSFLMVDKMSAMARERCREKIGRLSAKDLRRLSYALCALLELPCSS